MTEEDDSKRKSVNDFAADLMAAMKNKSSEPLGDLDGDEKEKEGNPVPPARESLLRTLENDVDALGWDQPAKLWGVMTDEDSGEEYLKLITTLKVNPRAAIYKIAKKGRAKENVKGVVVMTEAWGLPESITKPLADKPEAMSAWFRSSPPSEHPNRVECRTITMFNRDGSYATLERVRGGDANLKVGVNHELTEPVAELLGMTKLHGCGHDHNQHMSENDMIEAIDQMASFMKFIVKTKAGMDRVLADGGTPEQFIRGMLEDLDPAKREEMVSTMPVKLKRMLGL